MAPRVAASDLKDEKDVLVVSYRSHHNAFSPSDPTVTFVSRAKPLSAGRRLMQFLFTTTMVHYFLWIFPMFGSLWLFYAVGWWPVSVALFAYYLKTFLNGDQYKSGRPWHAFRQHPLWHLVNSYLKVEVVRTKKLDPSKKYVFAFYPHGILILSRVMGYGGLWERLFPGVETRVLGASPMFWSPGSREICLWMGAVDAARKVARRILDKFGLSLIVYPGGSEEIFETDPNSPITTLVARKGFIKLAVQAGADIVPGFVFGEKWLYHRRPISAAVKRWFMRNLRLPLIVFWGRYFSWLPYHDNDKAFLSMVFGTPIAVQQQEQPSDEYINELWEQYIAQIKDLYYTHRKAYGYPDDEQLVIREAKSEQRKQQKKTQ